MVSIHAPLKGATFAAAYCLHTLARFNSRTPEGCDDSSSDETRDICVSIHAPLKGATATNFPSHPAADVSIHAPLKGATNRRRQRIHKSICCFNSRTPEGCDVVKRKIKVERDGFNSRTPEGCDVM